MTAGLAHIFNHFYMNVYLSLSCKISVHLVYPTVIGGCCLIKVIRRPKEPETKSVQSFCFRAPSGSCVGRSSAVSSTCWQ